MSNLKNQAGQDQGSLGLTACVTMLVGGMIGSAIFSLSGLTVLYAGPASVLSWIIAAVIMLMYGLQVAELSTRFPKSGGVFVFPAKALGKNEMQGKIWGWLSFWGYVNSLIAGIAFSAIYLGVFLGVGFPALGGLRVPMAIGAVILCSVLNFYRISVTGKANTILLAILVLTMLSFIGVAFFGGAWSTETITPVFTQGTMGGTGFLTAIPIAMVAYGSVVAIAFMVGEVKDPNKNVPKSIGIAMGITVALYSLVIIATVGLISTQFLMENPQFSYIPLYGAAFTELTAFPWLPQVISIAAAMALLTTILVMIAIAARAIYATADGGLLPKSLSKINQKTGAPLNATIVVAVLSMLVASFPQFTEMIVNLGALFAAITISINIFALLAARRKFPEREGRYTAPGGTVLPVVTFLVIVAAYVPNLLEGAPVILYTVGWYVLGLIIVTLVLKRKEAREEPLPTFGSEKE